ncbi:hypothetical protein BH24BAC1_BH24BAC1_08190 [soil metagenome]
MKFIFPFLIVFLLAGNTAFSQTAAAPGAATPAPQTLEDRSEAITASMVKNLRLNPAQAGKVRQINLNSMQMVEALRQQYKTDPNRLDQEVKTISSSRLSQLKDVLTPAQFSAYQQRREAKMGLPKQAGSQN